MAGNIRKPDLPQEVDEARETFGMRSHGRAPAFDDIGHLLERRPFLDLPGDDSSRIGEYKKTEDAPYFFLQRSAR